MDFFDRVNYLCMQRGISITAMTLKLGFSRGTPSNWKSMGDKMPQAATIKKVADFFQVPVDYFLGKTDIKNPDASYEAPGSRELSESENTILELFRKIPKERQAEFVKLVESALRMQGLL